MSILVTGGAGYIGGHMTLDLAGRGEETIVLDNLSTGFRRAIPPGVMFHEGNAGDETLAREIIREHGVSTIVHFAGSIVVPDSVADPLGYYLNNTVNSRALIAAAVAEGVPRFIFSSTAAVYGMPEQSPVPEDAPLRPLSPYGSSKLMTEIMLADAARAHGLRYAALRYFNVAGADALGRWGQATPRATHLIKAACEAAVGKRPFLEIFGTDYETPDGTCVRDYIHVSDLVDAHRAALDHLASGGASGVWNCGYSRGFSVREVVAAVKRASGVEFEAREAGRRLGDPARIVAASDKIRRELGWRPARDDLDLIVAHALAWEKSLGRGAALDGEPRPTEPDTRPNRQRR